MTAQIQIPVNLTPTPILQSLSKRAISVVIAGRHNAEALILRSDLSNSGKTFYGEVTCVI